MPDAVDDFEASLNSDPANPAIPPSPAPAAPQPEISAPISRSLISQLQEYGVDALPDTWDDNKLVDHLVALQEQADLAAKLQEEKLAWEAERAAALLKQQQQAAPTQETPAPEQTVEFPYKPFKADRALGGLVKFDQESGVYLPKNPASLAHMQAAEEYNKELQWRQQFDSELYGDPEQFLRKSLGFVLGDEQKKYNEQLEALKAQLKPLADYVEQQSVRAKQEELLAAHQAKLFDEKQGLTAYGKEVQWLVDKLNIPLDQAIKAVEEKQAAQPEPVKPVSISKAAKPQGRLIDDAVIRMRTQGKPPADRTKYDASPVKWNATTEEIIAAIDANNGFHN